MSLETDRCRSPLGGQKAQHKHKHHISRGKIQKVFYNNNNKNTYLIVVDKQSPGVSQEMSNLTLGSVKSEMTSLCDRDPSDIVRRDLSNMDPDMEYDSGFSSTIFLENESASESSQEIKDSSTSTRSTTPNPIEVKKNDICNIPDFKPNITEMVPRLQTSCFLAGTISQSQTVSTTNIITSTSSMAYTTPTAAVNLAKQPAARKIILVTPNSDLSKNLTSAPRIVTSTPTLIRAPTESQTYFTSPQVSNVISSNPSSTRTPNELFVHVIRTPPQPSTSTPDNKLNSEVNQVFRTSIKTEPHEHSKHGHNLGTPVMHGQVTLDSGVKILVPQSFTTLRQGDPFTQGSPTIMPESPFSSPCHTHKGM